MSHPLDSPRAKLQWAQQHIDPFLREIERFREAHADEIVIGKTFNRETSQYVFKVDAAPEIPSHFGLVIGDLVHNLRSALDHLAWQLVAHGTQAQPQNPRLIQFPIYDSQERFAAKLDACLPGVRDTQRTFIESRQPYARENGRLGLLARFSNEDKHRTIHPVWAGIGSSSGELTEIGCRILESSGPLIPSSLGNIGWRLTPLHVDTVLLTVTVAVEDSEHDVEMKLAFSTYMGTDTARFVSIDPSSGEVGIALLDELVHAFADEVAVIVNAPEIETAFPA